MRRKAFLSGLMAFAVLTAACAPQAAPAPTAAPAKPAEATKPAEAAKPAAPAATTAPAAPAATTAPAAAAKPTEAPAAAKPAEAKPAAAAAPLRVGIPSDVRSLDPAFDNAGLSQNIFRNLYDTLVERSVDYEIKGVLAESWKTVEPTVWEFKLRKGVKFHNGADLVADDVVYTIDRILKKENASPMASYIGQITKAEATDPSTVRITTKDPYAPLPIALVSVPVVPKAAVEAAGNEAFSKKPIGSGPFTFVEWIKDDHITLAPNPTYWGGAPKIGQLTFKAIPEAATRAAALQTDQVDLIMDLPEQMIPEVQSRQNLKTEVLPSARTHEILVDMNVAPLNDVRVRRAVAAAIDYDALLKNVMGGIAQRVCQPVSPDTFGYDPNIKCPTYDPEMSKKLLAEAGLPNGFEVSIGGANGARPHDKEALEAIGAMLTKVGIKTNVILLETNRWLEGYAKREWPMTYHTNAGPGDAEYVFGFGFYSKTGRGYWKDPDRTDPLIDQSRAEFDPAKRKAILQKIMGILTEDVAWITLWVQPDAWGMKKTLNWKPLSDQRLDMVRATWSN